MALLFKKFPEPIYKNCALFRIFPNHLHKSKSHYLSLNGLLVIEITIVSCCERRVLLRVFAQPNNYIVFAEIKPAMY